MITALWFAYAFVVGAIFGFGLRSRLHVKTDLPTIERLKAECEMRNENLFALMLATSRAGWIRKNRGPNA